MLNSYLMAPFSKAYRDIPTDDHHIADEIVVRRPTLRQRVGLRLIHLGHQLRGPAPDRMAA
jgi:hypothetical protein